MARRAPGPSSRIPLVLLASCALVTASAARAGGYPGSRGPATPLRQALWTARYTAGPRTNSTAYAVGVSPDGSMVFVTGASYGPGGATVAYDAATGAQLWATPSVPTPKALALSPAGTVVFVAGVDESSTGDYATIAYDAATGRELWTATYNGGNNYYDAATAMGISPDGGVVFVTGHSDKILDQVASYATVAYDAATGDQLWVSRYDGPGRYSQARALGVSSDGGAVFVTGQSSGSNGQPDYATVAYDAATGGQLWVTRYDVPGISVAYALGVSPDGQAVFVTGESTGAGSTDDDYTTIAYNSVSGLQLWIANYNGTGDRDDTAYALGVSPDGSHVFVTGSSYGQSTTDIATVAYDAATGGQSWVARYADQQDGDAFPTALGVSPDGSAVFVAGVQSIPSVYITIAYTADTGTAKWAARFAQLSKGSEANALAVSPDGADVFVTGWFIDHNGFEDFATVAYPSGIG